MQFVQQAVGVGFVDDKGQVEVVRRLRNQMHALAAEGRPHVRQLVQQRTHAAADQRDRGARRDHLHAADFRQVRGELGEHVAADQILAGIERHGDVGFGRADKIDRQAVALETLEHIGEEADLLPHAHAFHRHQHDAVAAADRLHARHGRGAAVDARTRQFGALSVEDRHRHAAVAARCDRARMQHFGAGRRDFLRFGVVEAGQQARVRHFARIGTEHAGHVGPDLDALRFQQCAEVRGRGIGTAAAEDGGGAVGVTGDETLRNQHPRRLHRESLRETRLNALLLSPRVFAVATIDREPLRPGAGVRQRHRRQPVARIAPAEVEALRAQICSAQRRRQQLALRQHFGLPVETARCGARIAAQRAQDREAFAEHGVRVEIEFPAEGPMTFDQRVDAHIDLAAVRNRGQFVGDARQRGHHHQHARFRTLRIALIHPFLRQPADGVPAVTARHGRAAEFEHDPAGIGRVRLGHRAWLG